MNSRPIYEQSYLLFIVIHYLFSRDLLLIFEKGEAEADCYRFYL